MARAMTDPIKHMRAEIDRQDALLQRIYEFIRGRTDDVSIGVGRTIQPIEICSECGEENDYSQGKWCRCWSPVSQQDVTALEAMGVEIEDESEETQ